VPSSNRPQPIYPARSIRRASTLPVRFDDEIDVGDTAYREGMRRRAEREDSREQYSRRSSPERDAEAERRPVLIRDNYGREGPAAVPMVRDSVGTAIDGGRSASPSPVRTRERMIERDRSTSPVRVRERRTRSRSPPPLVIRNNYTSRSPSPVGYRERSRSHSYYDREYEDDEDTEKTKYSFSLSRHSKSPFSRDSSLGSISEQSESESLTHESQAPVTTPQVIHNGKVLQISRSRYTGDGHVDGVQSTDLTVVETPNELGKKEPNAIFRWM